MGAPTTLWWVIWVGSPSFLSDADRLAHRIHQREPLFPHVADVNAAVAGRDLGQLDDLLGLGEGPRWVLEAGGESVGAFLHRLVHQRAHLVEFRIGGRPVFEADHFAADRAVSDHQPHVDRRALGFEFRKPLADRQRRAPIRTAHGRGHPLAEVVLGEGMAEHPSDGVAVEVHETGHHRESRHVHSRLGTGSGKITYRRHPVAPDPDVRNLGGSAPAVVHFAAGEHHVIGLPATGGHRRRQQEQESHRALGH